jgi:ATP-dependent exoDNAse (exonuclease V) beta subunit
MSTESREDALAADARARDLALDVRRSWLVQAPAGSGKTELLIQRILALLAQVDHPEQIVAMTFTRKAAAEMRDRVLDALRRANDAANEPVTAHARRTRELARAALERDEARGWQLVQNPVRLRIMTIDALAASIARAAPVISGLGALPRFVDDATALYRAAARATLADARADDPDWRIFLHWLDNNAETAISLLEKMLAVRDRWPDRLIVADRIALRIEIERALADEIRTTLATLRELLPPPLAAEIAELAALALATLEADDKDADRVAMLRVLVKERGLPSIDVSALATWQAFADWTVTKAGTILVAPNVRHGFPAGALAAPAKARFERWLARAAALPDFVPALHALRAMPPARFDDDAWEFVCATISILPQAAARLLLEMQARREADFAEATQRALLALGTPEQPEDLLLAFDRRIAHLLIDEFQDTSAAQLALFTKLTEGWQAGDGRTLLAVGDPMQSIYRFREAEVRIFIEAQKAARVGNVPVGVVQLAQNFRARRPVVDWINAIFARVLPPSSDPARGEVEYRAAIAADASPSGAPSSPTIELFADRRAEAAAVVARIREAQAAGAQSVAVLVRARAHADLLLPTLRAAGIEYTAVELEALSERLATRDLTALARALSQPADDLAWLAVLRAPWCGLSLDDLLTIVEASGGAEPEHKTWRERSKAGRVWLALRDPSLPQRLSQDGVARLARFDRAITPAIDARGRMPLSLRVRSAWLALGGPACGEGALDRDGADRFFALLTGHERGGDLADFDAFVAASEALFANPPTGVAPVQLMTLHRAKGLEFDAVLLPGLDRPPRGSGTTSPLRWRMHQRGERRTLILAPLRARAGQRTTSDPVYSWLGALETVEEFAELGRLLYVGATRARRHLHLFAVAQPDTKAKPDVAWKRSGSGTALNRLWDAILPQVRALPIPDAVDAEDQTQSAPVAGPLMRVREDWTLPPVPPPVPIAEAGARSTLAPIFDWAQARAAAVGTVAHRQLASLPREGVDAWSDERFRATRPAVIAALAREGVDPRDRNEAALVVEEVIRRTLADPRGRWLFDPAHQEARSEWALAGVDQGEVVHIVVDRTFIAEGERWIVDFKTGGHEGGDPAAFLAREVERYRDQLARYARIVSALDARPVRLALYYPLLLDGFRELR